MRNKTKNTKQILSMMLVLVMMIGMLPAAVLDTYAEETAVAKVGKTDSTEYTEYTTIDEAINAWTDGTTLTLLTDVEYTSAITIPMEITVTLDLNGNEFFCNESMVKVDALANLTITDSSVKKDGSLRCIGSENPTIENIGTLNIINGKVINDYYATICNYGTLNISGGTIQSYNECVSCFEGSMTVSGSPTLVSNFDMGFILGPTSYDFSGVDIAAATGWTVYSMVGTITADSLKLPESLVLRIDGEEVDSFDDGDEATISLHTGGKYSVENDNVIIDSCINCDDKEAGRATITAEGGTYNGEAYEARVTKTGTLADTEFTISYTKEGESASTTEAPVNAGSYTASITLGEGNGQVMASVDFEIKKATPTADMFVFEAPNSLYYDGSKKEASVTVAENIIGMGEIINIKYHYVFSNGSVVDGIPPVKAGTYKVRIQVDEGENYTSWHFKGGDDWEFTIVDDMAPTGEITIEDNTWRDFLEEITFGYIYKDQVTVDVTADGTGSGVKSVEYLLSDTALQLDNMPATGWQTLTKTDGKYSFTIDSKQKGAAYVRITDEAENVAVINSDGIVVYEDCTIGETEFDYLYGESKDCEVQISLNDNTFHSITTGENTTLTQGDDYTIDETGKLTFNASYLDTLDVDKYTYTIHMNPLGASTKTVDYTVTINVTARPLSIASVTAKDRAYDGTDVVTITDVEVDGKLQSDSVTVSVSNLNGTLSDVCVGSYNSVILEDITSKVTLSGEDADNYVIVQPASAVSTNVTIRKAAAPVFDDVIKTVAYNTEKIVFEGCIEKVPSDAGNVKFKMGDGGPTATGNGGATIAWDKETGEVRVIPENAKDGDVITVPIKVCSDNYEDITYKLIVNMAIIELSQEDVTISIEDTIYNGEEQKQKVTVEYGTITLEEEKDFIVAYPSDCTSAGEKEVTIEFLAGYTGSVTGTYEIKKAPFIQGEENKQGWDYVRAEVAEAKDGDTITVDMNGSTEVLGDVIEDIKGKDITVKFDLGDGIVWTVNGKDVTGEDIADIDLAVTISTEENPIDTIPVEVINQVTGENYHMEISLAHNGEFGFTAVLSLNLKEENAGLYANLYYYNVAKNELEFICADEIATDGTADLTFTHASDYTIVITDTPGDEDKPEKPQEPENPQNPEKPQEPQNPEKPQEPQEPQNPQKPQEPQTPDTSDSSKVVTWMLLLLAGFGLVLAGQKKRER